MRRAALVTRPARSVASKLRRMNWSSLQDKLAKSRQPTSLGGSDEKPLVTLGVYGFIGLVALNGTVRAVDSLPLIPFLELVGILFSAFFVSKPLYKPDAASSRDYQQDANKICDLAKTL